MNYPDYWLCKNCNKPFVYVQREFCIDCRDELERNKYAS